MSGRPNPRQNRQPPPKHEPSTSFAVPEAGDGPAVAGAPNGAALAGTPTSQSPGAEGRSISELLRKIEDVCREIKAIKDHFADLEDIRNAVSAIQDTVKSELKKMREEIAAVNKRIMMKVDKIHNYLTGESDITKERSHSSKFAWQVNNFSKFKDQMLSGKAKPFYSDNFYVGTHGYKMYLSAHLAEKNSKGQVSLSVYMHITKGPYDRTLQWPYSKRSTFVVVDQKSNQHHWAAEVVPEELGRKQEHCFQRPRNGPNKGIGFTAMMPLEDLEDPRKGYLVNDSFLVHLITYDI
ncbi:hypothetical protein HPB48_007052 [Haemaphysalis longicornis]|uniref:MATH domain-containing protein n=1 Tax=Haemaphysalis longicornis TaxID=44386 RepID=A0A9J6GRV8_HAELO|nr:hypothetical protein HPB48_007052 [Haemaphysalis longicornis]